MGHGASGLHARRHQRRLTRPAASRAPVARKRLRGRPAATKYLSSARAPALERRPRGYGDGIVSRVACASGQGTAGGVVAPPLGGAGGAVERVLVVFETGRCGEAALREGAELASGGAELSVVTLAPQAKPSKCCGGGGAGPYNCAVRDQAEDELRAARRLLGSFAGRATFTLLRGSPSPPLAAWSARGVFDVILLPAPRLALRGGSRARALRRASQADVRLVR